MINMTFDKTSIREQIAKAPGIELELVWIPQIMLRQTCEEVAVGSTIERNGVGLNGRDASFITDLQEQICDGKHLSSKQAQIARQMLQKYSGQYEVISRSRT